MQGRRAGGRYMSAVFVTTENFIPQLYGGAVATYNYFKILHDPETILISYYNRDGITEKKATDNLRKEFKIKAVRLIPFNIKIRKNIRMLLRTALIMTIKRYPYLAAKFFSGSIIRSLINYIKREKSDTVFIDHMNLAFLAYYVKKIDKRIKVILINHNNEYELVAECGAREKGCLRAVFQIESRLIDRYQARYLPYIDDVRCISFTDADNLNQRYRTDKFSYFPMPYFFTREYRFNNAETNSIGMCGSLAWPLTIEGLKWYLDNIHPYLCENIKDYNFLLAGSGASTELINYVKGVKNVHYYGYVNDLTGFYEKCKLIAVPSLSGSGIRIKILESFSMSIPVVATRQAAQGLQVTNEVHLLCDSDPKKFTENVVRLLNDKALREKLSRNAYNYLREVHGVHVAKNKI